MAWVHTSLKALRLSGYWVHIKFLEDELEGVFFVCFFLHYVNIFNFPRHVSVSPTAFLGSDCLLLQYGVEWQQCLLIG